MYRMVIEGCLKPGNCLETVVTIGQHIMADFLSEGLDLMGFP
jgi:hypothetical protein